MQLTTSSVIESATYKKDGTLTIAYRNGRTYDYIGVPQYVYQELIKAASAGYYLNHNIKGRYPQRYATGTGRDRV